MKKTLIAIFATALAFGALADDELVKLGEDIAMPKSMNATVGSEGIPCVAIQVPHSKGGLLSVSCGKSSNVTSEDAITKLQAAMAKLGDKLVRFRVGDATFYGFYCTDCGGYEGYVVAMGGYSAIYVFPPKKGSGLDEESLDILKKAVFLPQRGFAIESAVKLYGPKSKMKPASKFPVLKKMVEARPESVELIALLKDVAKDTGNTATEAWCEAELKRLDPEVYGTATKSVPTYDFTCEKAGKIVDYVKTSGSFAKKAVTIPVGRVAIAQAAKPADAEAKGNKTKTITLPGGATMEMIWCPPGTYMMGSPKTEKGRANRERQIKVTLTKGFWLGKYEVTQKQYKSVIGKNPSKADFQGDNLPVGIITWPLADEFCKAVGQGARLPTSAEWEYACRAGTETAYPWGDSCNGKEANCDGTLPCGTDEEGPNHERPVECGSYPANPWGFCDMNGNMLEWCFDRDKSYGSDVKELVDPKGDEEETDRVLRGGSFLSSASGCRSAWRSSDSPGKYNLHTEYGFRIAMDE